MTREELYNFLRTILEKEELSSMIVSQIKKFTNQGITNRQIACAVCYFFEVKNGKLDSVDTYGIGIVPNIYLEAETFYNNQKRQEEIKKQDAQKKLAEMDIKEINVTPMSRHFIRKEYHLDD